MVIKATINCSVTLDYSESKLIIEALQPSCWMVESWPCFQGCCQCLRKSRVLPRLYISQCPKSFSPAFYFHRMESLAYSHSFSISKHVLLLINMTHMDESKATDCSTEAEIDSLLGAELLMS